MVQPMVDAKTGKLTRRYSNHFLSPLARQADPRSPEARREPLSLWLTITLWDNHVTATALLWVLLLSRALFCGADREHLVSGGFGGGAVRTYRIQR
jgi:hypothetical protein